MVHPCFKTQHRRCTYPVQVSESLHKVAWLNKNVLNNYSNQSTAQLKNHELKNITICIDIRFYQRFIFAVEFCHQEHLLNRKSLNRTWIISGSIEHDFIRVWKSETGMDWQIGWVGKGVRILIHRWLVLWVQFPVEATIFADFEAPRCQFCTKTAKMSDLGYLGKTRVGMRQIIPTIVFLSLHPVSIRWRRALSRCHLE